MEKREKEKEKAKQKQPHLTLKTASDRRSVRWPGYWQMLGESPASGNSQWFGLAFGDFRRVSSNCINRPVLQIICLASHTF